MTDISPDVDKTQSLADVVADDDDIRIQEAPILWTGSVKELKSIFQSPKVDVEFEWLVNVSQQRHGIGVVACAQSTIPPALKCQHEVKSSVSVTVSDLEYTR